MLKNVAKKLIISIVIIMIILGGIAPNYSYADLTETQRNAVADFAKNFILDGNTESVSETHSDGFWDSYIEETIPCQTVNNHSILQYSQSKRTLNLYQSKSAYKQHLCFDCSSFSTFVYDYVLGLGLQARNSNWPYTVSVFLSDTTNFYRVSSDVKKADLDVTILPGDLLITKAHSHIVVYIGNGKIAHASQPKKGLIVSDYYEYYYKDGERVRGLAIALRVKDGVVPKDQVPVKYEDYVWPEGDYNSIYDENWATEIQDTGFYYNGIPQVGGYIGSVKVGDLLFSFLLDALDWILGILTLGYKIQFIGWTSIIENIVSSIINSSTGQETGNVITNNRPDTKITLEKIIFNQIPILDINVFDFENAAGQTLDKNIDYVLVDGTTVSRPNIIYTIRENISIWYNAIRNLSIVCLLVILIYVGIRMTISTIAEEKAKYMGMLFTWLTGFIIVMFIHFFIYFVIDINNQLVNIFANVNKIGNNESTLYETIVIKAYDFKATQGWTGTVLYMVLVYYMVKFLFVYFKRLLVVNVLIIISPLVGIGYAINKLKSGKGNTGALSTWGKEFVFNVIIQSIHTILYIVFVGVAFEIATSSIEGIILGFVFLNFMLKAEKIVKTIFGIKANSLSDVLESTAGTMLALKAIKHYAKNWVGKPVGKATNKIANKVIENRTNELFNKYYPGLGNNSNTNGSLNSEESEESAESEDAENEDIGSEDTENGQQSESLYDVQERFKNAIREDQQLRYQMIKDSLSFGKNAVGGSLKVLAGIPMTIAEGGIGGAVLISGISGLRRAFPNRGGAIRRPVTLAASKKGGIVRRTLRVVGKPVKATGKIVLKANVFGYERIRQSIHDYSKSPKDGDKLKVAANSTMKNVSSELHDSYMKIMGQPDKINALRDEYVLTEKLEKDMKKLGSKKIYEDEKSLTEFEKSLAKKYREQLNDGIESVLARKKREDVEQVIIDTLQGTTISNITETDVKNVVKKMAGSRYTGDFEKELNYALKGRNIKKLNYKDLGGIVNDIVQRQDLNLPEDIRNVVNGVRGIVECQDVQGMSRKNINKNVTNLINTIIQDNTRGK